MKQALDRPRLKAVAGPLLLVLLPVVLSYGILQRYVRSLPMFDDYQALILFADHYAAQPTGMLKVLYVFTAQHDEYKLIFEHILFALDISAFGHIQYVFLALLGNLFVLALLALYWQHFLQEEPLQKRLLLFAPVSLLLFQLNYVETLDWAMCGLQMLPVILFSFLSFSLLLRGTRMAVWAACGSLLLAIFASGNGFLAVPVGLFLLVQHRQRVQRILAWCATALLGVAVYLHQYAPTYRQVVVEHATVLQRLRYFFSFAGSSIENLHHVPFYGASVVLGIGLVAMFVYGLVARLDRVLPFHMCAAGWLLLSAAGVAQVRIKLGLDSSLAMRYKLYSDLLMIFAYSVAVTLVCQQRSQVTKTLERRLYALALAICVVLYASSGYFGARFLKQRMLMEQVAFSHYLRDPDHPSPLVDLYGRPLAEGIPAKVWLDDAIHTGLYRPPAIP